MNLARKSLLGLTGHSFDVLRLEKPNSFESVAGMIKIISKLSPMVGNLIEINLADYLNMNMAGSIAGRWTRQDPGFPDVVCDCALNPMPGFEVKTWYPMATEITARFKDSQNFFRDNQVDIVMLAWIPDNLYFGTPLTIRSMVAEGISVARARDDHYHNPPDYLVVEPENTASRAKNLQQTNTAGYKLQTGSDEEKHSEAANRAREIGLAKGGYQPTAEYQTAVKTLMSEFNYRLDTNYAKMDRINHPEIEVFKTEVMKSEHLDKRMSHWKKLFESLAKGGKGEEVNDLMKIWESG